MEFRPEKAKTPLDKTKKVARAAKQDSEDLSRHPMFIKPPYHVKYKWTEEEEEDYRIKREQYINKIRDISEKQLLSRFLMATSWEEQLDAINDAAELETPESFLFIQYILLNWNKIYPNILKKINDDFYFRHENGVFADLDYPDLLLSTLISSLKHFRNTQGKNVLGKTLSIAIDIAFERIEFREKKLYSDDDQIELEDFQGDEYDYMSDFEREADQFGWSEFIPYSYIFVESLDVINKVGSTNNISRIIDMLKYSPRVMGREVGLTLSKIAPKEGVGLLLKLLREKDRDLRRGAAKALFFIELGKINISPEGVRIFEKLYDLQEYNNPDYFAQRISSSGQIGIFDENKTLVRYFDMDLDDDSKATPDIYDFPIEIFFLETESETDEQRKQKEQARNEFLSKYYEFLENDFFNGTNVGLNNNSLREQIGFYQYHQTSNKKQRKRLKVFLQKFGDAGFRTFVSITNSIDTGNLILEISEQMPEQVVEKIFKKYTEIVNIVENLADRLTEIIPDVEQGGIGEIITDIQDSLIKRSRELLLDFYEKRDESTDVLLKSLERHRAEILLFADTYKNANKKGNILKLEDIRNTEIDILSQREKEGLAEKLWDITRANRPFIKEGEELENRKENFFTSIKNTNSGFYVLRHGGEIVAFCSFTPDENGALYAESLNTESEVRGAKIGSEFFPSVLEKLRAQGKEIYGHVHPGNSGTLPYYKRIGFEVREVKEGDELKYYDIRIPARTELARAA